MGQIKIFYLISTGWFIHQLIKPFMNHCPIRAISDLSISFSCSTYLQRSRIHYYKKKFRKPYLGGVITEPEMDMAIQTFHVFYLDRKKENRVFAKCFLSEIQYRQKCIYFLTIKKKTTTKKEPKENYQSIKTIPNIFCKKTIP